MVALQQKMNADQVSDDLWVGGLPTDPESVDKQFDVLVLAAREFQDFWKVHKYPKTQVIHAPIDDAKPTGEEKKTILQTAIKIHEALEKGKKVLVTCAAGVNRSAVMAALAMIIRGKSADEAIKQIRKRRKPPTGSTPLKNAFFAKLLQEFDNQLNTLGTRTG